MNIEEVMENLKDRQGKTTQLKAMKSELQMSDEGELFLRQNLYALTENAKRNLAALVNVPPNFFADTNRCPPDLQAFIFNKLNSKSDETVKLILMDHTIFGLTNGDLTLLSGFDVLRTVLSSVPSKLKDSLEISKFHLDGSLQLSLTTPRMRSEPRAGDVVRGGLDIYHSETGEFATQLSSFLLRLQCSNGLLIKICRKKQRLALRRTNEENFQNTLGRIGEMAKTICKELEFKVKAIEKVVNKKISDPKVILEKIGRDLRLSRKLMRELVEALNYEEVSGTQFDIVNALSYAATHSLELNVLQRRRLMEEAGLIVGETIHRCPYCQSILRRRRR